MNGQLVGQPVLLQHPSPGRLVSSSSTVTIVLTACPAEATQPADVVIDTTINLNDYGNLAAAVPDYAAAIAGDAALGTDYVGSADMVTDLGAMVELFRLRFTVPMVPEVRGVTVEEAEQRLAAVGLRAEVQPAEFAAAPPADDQILRCLRFEIVGQSAAPGTPLGQVPGGVVSLDSALLPVECRGQTTDWAEAVNRIGLAGVPDVSGGSSLAQGLALLASAGLPFETRQVDGYRGAAQDREQCPLPVIVGQSVRPGTSIHAVNEPVIVEFVIESFPCNQLSASFASMLDGVQLTEIPDVYEMAVADAEVLAAATGLVTITGETDNFLFGYEGPACHIVDWMNIQPGTPLDQLPTPVDVRLGYRVEPCG